MNRPSRPSLTFVLIPALVAAITFLFWYQTWFGRRLADEEISRELADTAVPHKTQHALSQVAERILHGDPAAAKWYPQVVALAGHKEAGLRLMAAWVMGQDAKSRAFHEALSKLLADPDPMVRWNAALGLVRFGDASGRGEIRAMLAPYTVAASAAGRIERRVKEGDAVRRDLVIARVETMGGARTEIKAPLAGVLEKWLAAEGAVVKPRDGLAAISPSEDQVFEALRALYLVGGREDVEAVERFARGNPATSERIRQQAALTLEAFRRRSSR